MTDLKALASSFRVIADELHTIADVVYPPPVQQAPPQKTTDPNQAFQQQPPVQQPPVTQNVQQQAPAYTPPAQQQAAPPTQQAPINEDGFRAFSDQLVQLGRQAGPQGLGPIMAVVMPKYAPGAQGIAQVPPNNREPLLAEVRAYVAQQQAGGQQ